MLVPHASFIPLQTALPAKFTFHNNNIYSGSPFCKTLLGEVILWSICGVKRGIHYTTKDMLFNYNIEVKEIFAVVKFCYCLSYFTTAKISFTSILYLQFTHMIFIIYTLHNNYYNMLTSSRNKMYELIAGSVNCHVLPVRLGEVLCSLVDRSGNLSDCLPSSLFILSIEG